MTGATVKTRADGIERALVEINNRSAKMGREIGEIKNRLGRMEEERGSDWGIGSSLGMVRRPLFMAALLGYSVKI